MIDALSNLIDISQIVGSELINFKRKNKIESQWFGEQLKTNSDLFANDLWKKMLKNKFGNFDLISEEDNSSTLELNHSFNGFILDPIDGTRSYVENYKTYVTQIAYIKRGEIICSVVFAPELDMIFSSELNSGAFLNNQQLKSIKPKKDFSESIIIDNYPKPSKLIQKIMKKNNISKYKECGSLGLKISLIASNFANIMVKPNLCRIWDIAAPLLILSESKGQLFEYSGLPINLDSLYKNQYKGLIALSNNLDVSKIINSYKKNINDTKKFKNSSSSSAS